MVSWMGGLLVELFAAHKGARTIPAMFAPNFVLQIVIHELIIIIVEYQDAQNF